MWIRVGEHGKQDALSEVVMSAEVSGMNANAC